MATTTGYIDYTEQTVPATPSATHQRFYINSTTHAPKLVNSSGVESYFPGYEFDYAQVTSGGNITATVEASANTIVTGGAVTYDGSTIVVIEFYALGIGSAGGQTTYVLLFDGSTSLGYIGQGMTALNPTMHVSRRLTPSNASHTYSIRAITTGGTGTFTAGAGGAGANMPAFIRISKA